jgi:hypothetical protein
MGETMENISGLERGMEQDRDANFRICAYGNSKTTFKVIVTPQAVNDLKRFGLTLDQIATYAVEWAMEVGRIEGEITVFTLVPDFCHFDQWLTAIFKITDQS